MTDAGGSRTSQSTNAAPSRAGQASANGAISHAHSP